MAGHVAQGAATEIPPTAPRERMINLFGPGGLQVLRPEVKIRAFGRRPQPDVPIEVRGDGVGTRGADVPLRPPAFGAICPAMDLVDLANGVGPDHFAKLANAVAGMALIAHLGGDAEFAGGEGQLAGLPDGVGQGFLAIDVFAGMNGAHCGRGMVVIGDCHNDGVDTRLLFQHDPVIGIRACARIFLQGVGHGIGIDIAEGDDIFAGNALQIGGGAAAGADAGDVQLLVGRFEVGAGGVGRQSRGQGCGSEGGRINEVAPAEMGCGSFGADDFKERIVLRHISFVF